MSSNTFLHSDGTFSEEGENSSKGAGANWTAKASILVLAVLATTLIVAQSFPAASVGPAVMVQKARQQSLAWNGFTLEMQEEADKALRLCAVGLLGKKNMEAKHGCVKHVVPTTDTEWTHTDAGQNEWEETQNVLERQVSVAPLGPSIGTPGDFGDRR
eukprot:CAMPEP_0172187622 /NCGR_PEP_ID=MMETSP1050-20130122/21446_1 /TAXON_ID=233186 /ORGANISM="Cryptomonas curvata, Strain CCAP979/52" /LENGTH=157 /DNA_ID=CAMNT_0012861977 /DNA_START=75 /DNA_END=544 /DNA_ORIENTATION=-